MSNLNNNLKSENNVKMKDNALIVTDKSPKKIIGSKCKKFIKIKKQKKDGTNEKFKMD